MTKELVFADPTNQKARDLCADALEQLGYQSESGTWRNSYLTGALELREGNQSEIAKAASGGVEARAAMTVEMILDYIGILTDAKEAQDDDFIMNLSVTDTEERYVIRRKSGVLLVQKDTSSDDADCTLVCERLQFLGLVMGQEDVLSDMTIEGDKSVPSRLVKYVTPMKPTFNIIEP